MKTLSYRGDPLTWGTQSKPKSVQHKRRAENLRQKHSAIESFFTFAEVAELLLVSERTVSRWVDRKKLVAHQFGGATRIDPIELSGLIARARRDSAPLQTRKHLPDKFYTADDVAEILNVCVRTVRRHIRSGALIAHDFEGIIRIGDSDLHDFINCSRRD